MLQCNRKLKNSFLKIYCYPTFLSMRQKQVHELTMLSVCLPPDFNFWSIWPIFTQFGKYSAIWIWIDISFSVLTNTCTYYRLSTFVSRRAKGTAVAIVNRREVGLVWVEEPQTSALNYTPLLLDKYNIQSLGNSLKWWRALRGLIIWRAVSEGA
jgi:hypothetical protein